MNKVLTVLLTALLAFLTQPAGANYGYPLAVYAEAEPIEEVLANTFQLPRL